jgi:hypothetical protein
MKRFLPPVIIFFVAFFVYFAVGTQYRFDPKWVLDYHNLFSQSLINLRLDIPNPPTTYDLAYFDGKWYTTWGIIPALILIPLQYIRGQFIPTFYLSILFSSMNIVLMYFLLLRIKREFLRQMSSFGICIFLLLFAFGTTQFYVGTLGSVWHVDQIVTSFLGMVGIYIVFRKKRKFIHYLTSIIFFSATLLGRPTNVLLSLLPIVLYAYDPSVRVMLTFANKMRAVFTKQVILLCLPFVIFLSMFFLFNYVRFNNPLEYGFNYIDETKHLQELREKNGPFSIRNVPRNLWYMLFEIPSLNFEEKIDLNFNLKGNSIFFLTPPLMAIFLASPAMKKGKKIIFNPYISSLWIASVITLIPSLMHHSSGWMQFGYRYSLDVNVLLMLLSVFGMKGKVNILYIAGTLFAIVLYMIGITKLM